MLLDRERSVNSNDTHLARSASFKMKLIKNFTLAASGHVVAILLGGRLGIALVECRRSKWLFRSDANDASSRTERIMCSLLHGEDGCIHMGAVETKKTAVSPLSQPSGGLHLFFQAIVEGENTE